MGFFCIFCCAFWLCFVCVDAHSWTRPSEAILSSSPAMQSTPMERVEASSNSLCKVRLPHAARLTHFFNLREHQVRHCTYVWRNAVDSNLNLRRYFSPSHTQNHQIPLNWKWGRWRTGAWTCAGSRGSMETASSPATTSSTRTSQVGALDLNMPLTSFRIHVLKI